MKIKGAPVLYISISHLIQNGEAHRTSAHSLLTWKSPNNFFVLGGNEYTLKKRLQAKLKDKQISIANVPD
jgi:hypothetical protein